MQTTHPTRILGNSDLAITRIGFGAWAIGGSEWSFGWGAQDDARSIAAIHRALEHGVNWIDTAAAYGLGHSEEVVATALEGVAERPYVFTKCGLVPSGGGNVTENIRPESIVRECEASLMRLRTETIDLYQIHWPTDDDDEIVPAWEAIERLRAAGKIRHGGVSNFDVAQIERARTAGPVTSLQPPFSAIKRGVSDEILPYCARERIGVIVYSPMQSGLLTGAMTAERARSLPADDWRSKSDEYASPKLEKNLALADLFAEIGRDAGRTAGEVAIAWTLHDPAVTGAIVGGRSPEQVDGVAGALDYALDDATFARIAAYLTERKM